MKKSTRFLIIATFVLALVFGFALLVSHKDNNKSKQTTQSSPADNGPVLIANTSQLSSILLQKQYNAVYFGLSAFIRSKISPDIKTASVSSNVSILKDGSLSFTVATAAPKVDSFTVSLDRSKFDRIYMTIPKYNYAQTLLIY